MGVEALRLDLSSSIDKPMSGSNEVSMTAWAGPGGLLRGDGVAAWRRIADGIEADLRAGRLGAGDQLPTEARLAERFGVNRHTVRRALAVLASRGLVRATQGRGTFVEAQPLPYPIGERVRFSEIVSGAGREASGELVASAEAEADPWVAGALAVSVGAPVLSMRTLRRADGTPIALGDLYVPLPRLSGLDGLFRELGSLTRAFAAKGIPDYVRASTRVTARPVDAEEAALLELAPGRIALAVESVNLDRERRPIQATRALMPADRVELVFGG
jgi:GntR family phosphonate transport system transcriptional regulator